jgi:hypothetical protein
MIGGLLVLLRTNRGAMLPPRAASIVSILPFADVKSLPLFYAFERAVYDA